MRTDSESFLLPLDVHLHKDGVDPLVLGGERNHADFFVAVFEQKILVVCAEVQIVDLMLEVEEGVGWPVGLAEKVDVDLVDGLFRVDPDADCNDFALGRKAHPDYLALFALDALVVSSPCVYTVLLLPVQAV